MSFTTDLTTDIGKLRLLISDTDAVNWLFQDDAISFFLAQKGNNLQRAAALAYRVIAGNQALTLKVIKLLQLSTDGAKTAEALLSAAKAFEDSATFDEASSGGLFDWAEQTYPLNADERLLKQILREQT